MPTIIVQVTDKLSPVETATVIACAENMFIVEAFAVQCPPVEETPLHVASNSPAAVTVVALLMAPPVVRNVNGVSVAITTVPPLLDTVPTVSVSTLTAIIPPAPDDATVVAPASSRVVSAASTVIVPFPIPMYLNPSADIVQLSEVMPFWNA